MLVADEGRLFAKPSQGLRPVPRRVSKPSTLAHASSAHRTLTTESIVPRGQSGPGLNDLPVGEPKMHKHLIPKQIVKTNLELKVHKHLNIKLIFKVFYH